jgi:hypothetical protein
MIADITLHIGAVFLFLLLAVVCFVIAAIGRPRWPWNWVAIGLAFLTVALMFEFTVS